MQKTQPFCSITKLTAYQKYAIILNIKETEREVCFYEYHFNHHRKGRRW